MYSLRYKGANVSHTVGYLVLVHGCTVDEPLSCCKTSHHEQDTHENSQSINNVKFIFCFYLAFCIPDESGHSKLKVTQLCKKQKLVF